MSMFDKRKDTESDDDRTPSAPPAAEPRPRMTDAVSPARGIAMIGRSITIKGDITGDESLVIDGKVEGTVALKGNDLTVGQSGHVGAEVTANVVRIEGEVTGDITGVEKVVVTKTGRLRGNIVAPRVTLEDGSKFKGSIDMDPGHAQQPGSSQPLKSVPSSGSPAGMDSQPGKGIGTA